MRYIKTKKHSISECNICGQVKNLTWDHVPPKGILSDPAVYANTVFTQMPTPTNHMKEYQSGIRYRTICRECNNVVLGKNDMAYKEFMDQLIQAMKIITQSQAYYPRMGLCVDIPCKINRILRAMCGHVLAAKEEYDSKKLTDGYMREYVLDENLKLEKIKIFTWVYPYSTIVISRDFTVKGHLEASHPRGLISIVNSFPLAIVVSTEDETGCILDDFGKYSTENIEDTVTVRVHMDTAILSTTDRYKTFNWPIDISDDEHGAMFVLGNHTVFEDSRLAVRK